MPTDNECGYLDKMNGCRVEMSDLDGLPLYHRQTIPEDFLDAMGHMNVRWYMALFDATLESHSRLSWEAPVCGVIRV